MTTKESMKIMKQTRGLPLEERVRQLEANGGAFNFKHAGGCPCEECCKKFVSDFVKFDLKLAPFWRKRLHECIDAVIDNKFGEVLFMADAFNDYLDKFGRVDETNEGIYIHENPLLKIALLDLWFRIEDNGIVYMPIPSHINKLLVEDMCRVERNAMTN